MKAGKRKALILSLLFLAALVIGMLGSPEKDTEVNGGTAFKAASLPVMCFSYGDQLINPLYGRTDEAGAETDNLSVYPFTEDSLSLTVHLVAGTERPRSAAYELRSEDGSRLIGRGEVRSFTGTRADRYFTVDLPDLLDPDTYYRLIWTVRYEDAEARYFTRLMKLSDPETLPMLTAYAADLHQAFFSREEGRAYAAKLETDPRSDKNTFAYVNIQGNLDQVTWGNAQITPISDPWLRIEAVQGNYVYVSYDYLLRAVTAETIAAELRVRESMTLQRDKKAVYLLSYERHAEQLWTLQENEVVSSGIILGVQEAENLSAVKSPNGQITAFTVAGELYSYDSAASRLTRIFSFRSEGEHDLRKLCRDYSIKIMSAADSGDVEFAVYGYMNGGSREGEVGISYCVYEPSAGEIREKMYLDFDGSYETLKGETETLFMTGNDHFLYFCFEGQVFVMDFSSGEMAVLVSREEMDSLVINEAGTAFAWQSGADQQFPKTLRVVDLVKNRSETVEAKEGEAIYTLGFMREDLIVGLGRKENGAVSNGIGDAQYYYALEILDPELACLHHYEFQDMYINGIDIDSEKITVHRFSLKSSRYYYADIDVMLRGDSAGNSGASFGTYNHETLRRMAMLNLPKMPSYLRIEKSYPNLFQAAQTLALPDSGKAQTGQAKYYAYGGGRLIGRFDTLGKAAAAAGDSYGYVIRSDGTLSWSWSARREKADISLSETLNTETPQELSGASFRQLMYFLNQGTPVLWASPDKGELWIVGYDWQDAALYDPETQEITKIAQSEMTELIRRENNYLWCFGR